MVEFAGWLDEPTFPPSPVRTAVERGSILWADAYLDSESVIRTRLDPRLLEPAPPVEKPNRAARRRARKQALR